jgi:large subunit ribosomal protein L30
MSQVKITLVRGLAGKRKDQKAVAESLGLRKTNSSTIQPNNAATMGKVKKIENLLKVEEI